MTKPSGGVWVLASVGLGIALFSCRPTKEAAPGWTPVQGRIMTRWAADVDPQNVWPEYPRPQMERKAWLNLNGLWKYAIRPSEEEAPEEMDGTILVPFPVESALSGVGRPVGKDLRVWYRRTFRIPKDWDAERVILRFEAVDWETRVWINGREIGIHRGGYDPFALDITDALRQDGDQEILVAVWDPADEGHQPRGKQVRQPHGIWYTSVTGIWGTVWLEPVPELHIDSLRIMPDIDAGKVAFSVRCSEKALGFRVAVEVREGETVLSRAEGLPGEVLTCRMESPNLWSPESPFLYKARVSLLNGEGHAADSVRTFFGMRKISLGKDEAGHTRVFLNNRPVFMSGPLDQGWWPDGLYTAPTEEALRYDLEVMKKFGFNMLRKHVKVEPRLFYALCDRLGILVWQDMPSGDASVGRNGEDIVRSEASARQFEQELERIIRTLWNHPSIVMWVAFNEGWGQYDTQRITALIEALDPTRLVDSASGWADRGVGDVCDIHAYPGPEAPSPEPHRAAVLGEFGGLGLPIPGHTWQEEKSWGYRSFETAEALTNAYVSLIEKLKGLKARGLSAAVYTQITDVEIEVNGLMTYDRALIKIPPAEVADLHRALIGADRF